ncbi:MAG: tRNA lysidine(34) synthetase TilS [Spirochaetaceae bacterium]|jgi:tRNA(Ile)-lysidine synthetase-like protein|nr:tRNA lysidine(34) synthetase TilS [Spirochaetaceae bacterium]
MGLLDCVSGALGLLPGDVRLLAAVSGGADSTAMLAACAAVKGRAFCESGGLRVAHVDHGLRSVEECAGDAEAVRALCEQLGIGCTVAAVGRGKIEAWAREKGSGIEAAARHFRYEALRHEAERVNAGYVLVAHTQDDALETALMRVLRGSGPRGLALMPQQCRFAAIPSGVLSGAQNFMPGYEDGESWGQGIFDASGGGAPIEGGGGRPRKRAGDRGIGNMVAATSPLMILRPLRDVTREEVIAYLAEQGFSYRTDSTNSDVRYLRNRIRRQLVPVLDANFPEWRKGLREMAETQGLAADFIEDEAEKRVRAHGNGVETATVIENLDELPEILREEALFAAIDRIKGDARTVRRRVVRDFAHDERDRAADAGDGIRLSRGLPVRVARDEAFYEKGFSLLIKDAGEYRIDGLVIQAAKVDGGLVIHIEG